MSSQLVAQDGSDLPTPMIRIVIHEGEKRVQLKLDDILVQLDANSAYNIGAMLIQAAWEAK